MDMVCSAFDPVLSPPRPATTAGNRPCKLSTVLWTAVAGHQALMHSKEVREQARAEGLKLRGALNNKTGYFGVTHIPHTSKFKPYQARVWPAGWQA